MNSSIKPIRRMYSEKESYQAFLQRERLRRLSPQKQGVESSGKESGHETKSEKLYSAVTRHRILAAVFILMFVASMVFYASKIISVIMVLVLLILASFSTIYKRKMGMPLGGVELVTFSTVLVGIAFNPIVGLLFGIVSSLASSIISQDLGPLTWMYVFSTGMVGILASYFSHLNIVFLGIAATVLLLLINQVIYLFIGDEDVKTMTVFYMATNIIANFILFTTVGERVLSFLVY